jgi:PemK-like, MazF-like toxin of type II toxin-antitoxin system
MAVKDMFRRALATLSAPAKRRSGSGDAPRGHGEPGRAVGRPAGSAPSTDIADLDGMTVTYSPEPGRTADPGEVVWTWVPYEDDPSQGKDRPVALFGRRDGDLVGVALTTKPGHPHEVLVGTGAWDPQRRPSFAKLDRILDVDPTKVRRVGGVLDRDRFDDLVDALRRFYR